MLQLLKSRFVSQLANDRVLTYLYSRTRRFGSDQWVDFPFYFLHLPKCAGTALCHALDMPDPGHVPVDRLPFRNRRALANKPALIVVRDPIARIRSTFRYAHEISKLGPTFLAQIAKYDDINDWISQRLNEKAINSHYFLFPALKHIIAAQSLGMPITVIAIERLEEGIQDYLQEKGVFCPEIPKANVSTENLEIRSDIDAGCRERVAKLYESDARLWDVARNRKLLRLP